MGWVCSRFAVPTKAMLCVGRAGWDAAGPRVFWQPAASQRDIRGGVGLPQAESRVSLAHWLCMAALRGVL